jgi:hypothetical protein
MPQWRPQFAINVTFIAKWVMGAGPESELSAFGADYSWRLFE